MCLCPCIHQLLQLKYSTATCAFINVVWDSALSEDGHYSLGNAEIGWGSGSYWLVRTYVRRCIQVLSLLPIVVANIVRNHLQAEWRLHRGDITAQQQQIPGCTAASTPFSHAPTVCCAVHPPPPVFKP